MYRHVRRGFISHSVSPKSQNQSDFPESHLPNMGPICLFPECVAKASRCTSGVCWLRRGSMLLCRPQAYANRRRQRSAMRTLYGRAYSDCCKNGHFWRCEMSRNAFVWQAWQKIATCFLMCQKSFCVTGAILLRSFQKMICMFIMFRGRRSRRRSILDLSRCVFL